MQFALTNFPGCTYVKPSSFFPAARDGTKFSETARHAPTDTLKGVHKVRSQTK